MLTRANVTECDTVLVPGASGGVGGAVVQLAASRCPCDCNGLRSQTRGCGGTRRRPAAAARAGGFGSGALEEAVTVVADVVGGAGWPALIESLERGGRYLFRRHP